MLYSLIWDLITVFLWTFKRKSKKRSEERWKAQYKSNTKETSCNMLLYYDDDNKYIGGIALHCRPAFLWSFFFLSFISFNIMLSRCLDLTFYFFLLLLLPSQYTYRLWLYSFLIYTRIGIFTHSLCAYTRLFFCFLHDTNRIFHKRKGIPLNEISTPSIFFFCIFWIFFVVRDETFFYSHRWIVA